MRTAAADIDRTDLDDIRTGAMVTSDGKTLAWLALGDLTLQTSAELDPLLFSSALIEAGQQLQDAIIDLGSDQVAERRECWCGHLLGEDEITCGAERCMRAEQLDRAGLVP